MLELSDGDSGPRTSLRPRYLHWVCRAAWSIQKRVPHHNELLSYTLLNTVSEQSMENPLQTTIRRLKGAES